ncbi:MAG: nitroreductase family protein [Smithellaceae bacterium]|nr:nitroreductase family protein [Smithellaceae bacterium]
MDFQELLKNRRAVRDFEDKKVPFAVVEEIIADSTQAPTASNAQPCRFIVVDDQAMIKMLSDDSKKSLLCDLQNDPTSSLSNYSGALQNEGFNVFYNAPCLVIIVGHKDVWSLDIDSALTAAYFMLSATARGLGTCWVALGANIRTPELLSRIGLEKTERIVAPVILGYPRAIPEAPPRREPRITKV